MLNDKIKELITPTAKALGYKVINVNFIVKPAILKIVIDRFDEKKVKVLDCQTFSKAISAVLDVENIIPGKYFLEVESAGIERSLMDLEDFIKFLGYTIQVKLVAAINENKKYIGVISNIKGQEITLNLQNDSTIAIDYDNIKVAKIVFTDEMFRQITKNY
ncbi:ribosome maturation factor [Orientia tsutsugamushi]|uniref:Ribosome maturation factor RimP n=1 Tax=Orientia tsutsugamushi TaxID=784 RepID=A0A2R8F0J8_ORITS|nr:ribosome maturation factor RimP [Orientia tsutsugamushi]SPM44778.1 ribosome maturation factor [Orientia tsutsugamushi]